MWQSFTDRARLAGYLATQEAAGLGEKSVGTEHLLRGLVRDAVKPEAAVQSRKKG